MAKHVKQKREFSKIMAVIAVGMWLLVNLFGLAIVALTFDTTPMMYIVPSVDAVVAVVLSFYFWKARAENQIKLKKIYGADANSVSVDMPEYPYTGEPLYENTHIV